jgi:diacylglycerol kinase family enzyme
VDPAARSAKLARVRVTLIVNPHASRVTPELVEQVAQVLQPVETLFTQRPGHAIGLARSAGGDAVVVFSGDGGFNEVLNGLRGGVPIGFVPGGGTSVLPRALGLPRDPVEAARVIALGRRRRISLGRIDGRRFAFSAGLGLDAEGVRRVDALGRRPDGRRPGDLVFARTLVGIAAARRFRFEPVLVVEGIGRGALAFVSNAPEYTYVGPRPLRISPCARFEAGLDVTLPVRVTPALLTRYLGRLLVGRGLVGARGVLHGHDLDRFSVRCDVPIALQADGEDLGDVREVVFEAERGAVEVLC